MTLRTGIALAAASLIGTIASASDTPPDPRVPGSRRMPKRREPETKPESKPHPAMPEGGWPESRQARRQRERNYR